MAKVQADVDTKEPLKMKRKPGRPKKLSSNNEPTKINLKKEEDAISKPSTVFVDEDKQAKDVEKVEKRASEPRLEELTKEVVKNKNEDKEVTVINEAPVEKKEEVKPTPEPVKRDMHIPENVEKLISFMKDTGGNVEDYVTLNKDYNKYDDELLVKEYYKKTRPHLDDEEINFVMEDNFKFDEEVDEERFVRKQRLKYKEEVAKAKNFLEQMKSKYYDEIKLRPSVTNEQKKAMDFFQRYSEEQQQITEARNNFVNKTKNFFQEEFKGFEFNLGEKAFRYNVSNANEMIDAQSDVSKIINKFSDNDGNITDMDGYHKAIYAARNADRLAQHFYEQGKADATKDIVAKSKNINQAPRSMPTETSLPNGWKVRAVTGVDSSKLKVKNKKS